MTKYEQRAIQLQRYFGIYGYGNFDINTDDIAELLEIMDQDSPESLLRNLYERLEATRMV